MRYCGNYLATSSFFALTIFAFATPVQAATSDFSSDMQSAIHTGEYTASTTTGVEYESAWDEFGTSIIVSGGIPASQISEAVMSDITHDMNRQVGYEQAEVRYLEAIHSTPEDVQAAEANDGSDLLSQDSIDPHPSLDANPDVNYSSLDDLPMIDIQTQLQASTDTNSSNSIQNPATSTTEDATSTDFLMPPSGDWQPDDITVFQAIVDTPTPTDGSNQPTDNGSNPVPADTPSAPIIPDQTSSGDSEQ